MKKILVLFLGAFLALSPVTVSAGHLDSRAVAVVDDWYSSSKDDDWDTDTTNDSWEMSESDDWETTSDDDWESGSNDVNGTRIVQDVSLKEILLGLGFFAVFVGILITIVKVQNKKSSKNQSAEDDDEDDEEEDEDPPVSRVSNHSAKPVKRRAIETENLRYEPEYENDFDLGDEIKKKVGSGIGKFGVGMLTGVGAGMLASGLLNKNGKEGDRRRPLRNPIQITRGRGNNGTALYKVNDGTKIHGPYTLAELLQHVRVGHVKAGMLVLKKGGTWKPAREYPEIKNNR